MGTVFSFVVGPAPLFMQHSVSTILLVFPSLLPWFAAAFRQSAAIVCGGSVYVVDVYFSINSGGGFSRTWQW